MVHEDQDRYALADRVYALLAPELAAESLDLVDVRIFRGGGRLQVRLYVDRAGDAKVGLEDCARASRSAGILLEEADPFSGPYVLEVSSPGIRRPLRRPDDFAAVVGQDVELKLRRADGPPRRLRGRLLAASATGLTVLPAGTDPPAPEEVPADETGSVATEAVDVSLAEVLEANLDRDLDVRSVINADRRRRKERRREDRQKRRKGSRRRSPKTEDGAADRE